MTTLKKSKKRVSPIWLLTGASAALLIVAVAMIFLIPLPDESGRAELADLQIIAQSRSNTPLDTIIADLNAQIAKSGNTRMRLALGNRVTKPPTDYPVSPEITGEIPVLEYANWICALRGLQVYSTADGIVLDYYHSDHRSWRRKFRDWVKHDVLWRWYGRMYKG
jgi:hypothetical protein